MACIVGLTTQDKPTHPLVRTSVRPFLSGVFWFVGFMSYDDETSHKGTWTCHCNKI